jgi:adenylate kinase
MSQALGIAKISTGDILREAVRAQTPLGREAKNYMDAGKLVPDDVVIGIIRDRLQQPDTKKGYILDGFPRTVAQAEALGAMLTETGRQIDRVVNFTLDDEHLVRRISGRRSCPGCQAVYHVESSAPRVAGVCDRCGKGLAHRSDDLPETVRKRLEVFRAQTAPLIDYYQRRGLLTQVAAEGGVEQVFDKVMEVARTAGAR